MLHFKKRVCATAEQYIHKFCLAISSSVSHERHFFGALLLKKPRFQANMPSNRWYIARIFQLWLTPSGYQN